MARNGSRNNPGGVRSIYSPGQLEDVYPEPILQNRAPTANDKYEAGTIWVDQTNSEAYIEISVAAGAAVWENITSSNVAGVTDGQLFIGDTGGTPIWANLTSLGGSVTITNGAGTINLEAAGVAALTSLDGDAGTATPIAGVINVLGGTNITTAGAGQDMTINLDASPAVAGSLTAGVDFTMTSGTCVITSSDAAGDDIYLHANGGVAETIHLYADQGTGTDSIHLESDVGGVTIDGGIAAANAVIIDASDAAGGIDVDAGTGGINITTANGAIALASGTAAINIGVDAVAHAVTVGTTTGAGSTVIQSGTGDVTVTSTDAIFVDGTGVVEVNSSGGAIGIGSDADANAINIGTGAAARTITMGNVTGATGLVLDCGTGDVTVGASATAHNSTFGSTNTTSDTVVQSGTGNLTMTSTDAVTVDAVGVLELNSSAGIIGIGNDADAQNINVGTGAAARTITIGNATGATAIAIDSGTGDITLTSTDAAIIDCAGVLELNSTAGVIGIGSDADAQNINIGTGAAARTITIGNATGATSVVLNAGTGAVNIGTNAIAHTTTVGTTTGAGATTVQAGTGDLIVNGGGDVTVDAVGVLELNSSAGIIGIGNDAIAQNINIGTGAAARDIVIGNATAAASVVVDCGTGGVSIGASATAHASVFGSTDTTSSTTIQSGTGDVIVTSTDAVTVDCAGVLELNSTAGVIGIGSDADAQNINIGTGAAARTITIGNVTGATSVVLDAGTGVVNLGASATAHATTLGSTTTTSTTTVQGGTGGIVITPTAGDVSMAPATSTVAGIADTLNAKFGAVTFTGQLTAAAATVTFTVTNDEVSTTSVVLATVSNLGTNDSQMTLTRVEQKAGSIEFTCQNLGAAALNGNVVVCFWILD